MPEWKDILGVTPLIGFFLICAWLIYKTTPAIKEVKLGEQALRREEAIARVADSRLREKELEAVIMLTETVEKSGELTEELRIFLRATMRQSEVTDERLLDLEAAVKELRATTGHNN